MPRISVKPGDSLTIDGDVTLQIEEIRGGRATLTTDGPDDVSVTSGRKPQSREDAQERLRDMTEDVLSILSAVDTASSQELLSSFVSDLFLLVVQKRQQEERRRKQASGIAAAKRKGVRFGPAARTLPDNFEEVHQAWRKNQMTLKQAAAVCGMPVSSFYEAAVRKGGLKGAGESKLMERAAE